VSNARRRLQWFGGQGEAVYDGVTTELRSKPHVEGVREFSEIRYQPSAHVNELILPRTRAKVTMKIAEREACDRALNEMARAARAGFHKA
jgi:hypothetical protein